MLGSADVHRGQGRAEDGRPVRAAGRRRRVGQREVQRRGATTRQRGGSLDPLEDLRQLAPTILIHQPHQGRIAEVEQPGPGDQVVAHVIGREGVVGAGVMQEDAVDARCVHDHGVGGGDRGIDHHAVDQSLALGRHDAPDRHAEQVVAHLAHQPGHDAQLVQHQPGVRDRAAGGEHRRPHLAEPARRHQAGQPPDRGRISGMMSRHRCPATMASKAVWVGMSPPVAVCDF